MENNQRNSRKRLNSLILLVAFTAVMLIVSTYAWFSSQKNVNIGGLQGIVKVAEGLEISLDARNWSQEVNFANYTSDQLKKQYGLKSDGTVTGHTFSAGDFTADDVKEHNIIPSELLPVSTTGLGADDLGTGKMDGIGLEDMNMYRGIVSTTSNKSSLTDVIAVKKGTSTTDYTAYDPNGGTNVQVEPKHHDYPGYYAIDLFLKNSTRSTEAGTTNYSEVIQLNNSSKVELINNANVGTGLQNTLRIAFAVYNAAGDPAPDGDDTGTDVSEQEWSDYIALGTTTTSNYMTASTSQILNAFKGQTIKDVAIWEPNVSQHVDYIKNNVPQYINSKFDKAGGSYPKFSLADTKIYVDADATTAVSGIKYHASGTGADGDPYVAGYMGAMRTYALSQLAVTADDVDVADIYDWDDTPTAGLKPQVTLQTNQNSDYTTENGVKNLVSVTSPADKMYVNGEEEDVVLLKMQDGAVAKVRMYVWLEGQDVDTINHASHGGGIKVDVGLLKDATAEQVS